MDGPRPVLRRLLRRPLSVGRPEGLKAVLITGGLPSLDAHADDVYRAAYPRIERKVAAHYARYPQDVERAREITAHLAEHRPESASTTV